MFRLTSLLQIFHKLLSTFDIFHQNCSAVFGGSKHEWVDSMVNTECRQVASSMTT